MELMKIFAHSKGVNHAGNAKKTDRGSRSKLWRVMYYPVRLPRTGDNHERSDIDLAVLGLPETQKGNFCAGIDELPTLLKFDIVFVDSFTSPALLAEVKRDE